MNYYDIFNEIMDNTRSMSLATINPQPNVRIVDFIYVNNKIYFTTFPNSAKENELEKTSSVALTTIPTKGEAHVRINDINAVKSEICYKELVNYFTLKNSEHLISNDDLAKDLLIYEIDISNKNIYVVKDYMNSNTITLEKIG